MAFIDYDYPVDFETADATQTADAANQEQTQYAGVEKVNNPKIPKPGKGRGFENTKKIARAVKTKKQKSQESRDAKKGRENQKN
jgi:hypothetical protein